jgi:hypothetical protein
MYLHLNIHNSSTRSHPSEEEIALEIAAKIASVNRPLGFFKILSEEL